MVRFALTVAPERARRSRGGGQRRRRRPQGAPHRQQRQPQRGDRPDRRRGGTRGRRKQRGCCRSRSRSRRERNRSGPRARVPVPDAASSAIAMRACLKVSRVSCSQEIVQTYVHVQLAAPPIGPRMSLLNVHHHAYVAFTTAARNPTTHARLIYTAGFTGGSCAADCSTTRPRCSRPAPPAAPPPGHSCPRPLGPTACASRPARDRPRRRWPRSG